MSLKAYVRLMRSTGGSCVSGDALLDWYVRVSHHHCFPFLGIPYPDQLNHVLLSVFNEVLFTLLDLQVQVYVSGVDVLPGRYLVQTRAHKDPGIGMFIEPHNRTVIDTEHAVIKAALNNLGSHHVNQCLALRWRWRLDDSQIYFLATTLRR